MWTDDTNEGGFDISSYGSSPTVASQDNKQARKPNSLFPVSIKQILDFKDDTMTISGYPVSMMTVVGWIRSIELTSTKITYRIEDWSGSIMGMLWLEGDADDHKSPNVIENTYCRITGTKRTHDGNACVFVYNISPIEDFNEITFHYLQVIHIGLKAEEMRQSDSNQQGLTNMGMSTHMNGFANGTFENDSTSVDGLCLTPHQRIVYSFVKTKSDSDSGINKNDIVQTLKSRLPVGEIEKAIEFLSGEGHMYNTIDDDHYKVTES